VLPVRRSQVPGTCCSRAATHSKVLGDLLARRRRASAMSLLVTRRVIQKAVLVAEARPSGVPPIGQDHPTGSLVIRGAGNEYPVQTESLTFHQPGREHARRVTLPTPRCYNVVADVASRLSQLRGERVTNDERAEVVLARNVPEDRGRGRPTVSVRRDAPRRTRRSLRSPGRASPLAYPAGTQSSRSPRRYDSRTLVVGHIRRGGSLRSVTG